MQLLSVLLFTIFTKTILCQFEQKLEYTIQENQPPGIQVGHISYDLIHLQKTGAPKSFDSTYTFHLRDTNEYFQLNKKTSVLKTDNTIDLEALCPKYCNDKGMGFIKLVINVFKGNQLRGVIQVKVVVMDQNDNVPIFPMKVFEKKIKEVLYGIGKMIELPKAIDRDITTDFNKVVYKLNEPSDTFQLQVTNDSNPKLLLTKDIDYETQNQYLLTLIAWNIKSPAVKSYLEIKVEVIDINDCEPMFPNTLLDLSLDENSKPGKLVTKLKAIDKDKNSKLIYGMALATKQINKDTFLVKDSGEVVLIKELDIEIQNEYDLPVFATDGEFIANAKLRIVIRDVNNHPPSYNLNPASLSIEENQPSQILIGQVTVSDVDSTEVNGNIRCKEPQGKSNFQSLLFRPDPADNPSILKYDMYSRIPLDREEGAIQLIYLICQDGGLHERLTSTLTVSLVVLDVNDNPPQFPKQLYTAEIGENNAIGDKLIQMQAIDKDFKENAVIFYSIVNNANSNMFFIDHNTGWINVMRELDREESDSFQLMVVATNKPSINSFSATATLKITVTDKNDNRPQLKPPSQFSVLENLKPHTFIGNLNAKDKDSGNNGKMIFSLMSTAFEHLFEVKRNGSIFSKIAFDREITERYCLNIRVNDLGLPVSLSVTGTICILIMDVNDNVPVISVTNSQTESLLIDSQAQNSSSSRNNDLIIASVYEAAGYKIASVNANDIDKDENAQTTFLLEEMSHDPTSVPSLFMIDEMDGSIKISRVMSRDHIGEYKVKIIVHDKGKPILKAEKIIRIQIKDIPPQSSLFQNSNIHVTGNVLIVIILSTISAFLTALLIGAILCMIKPCCRSDQSGSNSHQDSQNTNTQTLLQKISPNYYTVNPYGQYEPYDPQWMQTITRNGQSYGAPTLDLHQNSTMDKIDYVKYESPPLHMSQKKLCYVDHVVGKHNGCSCEQGVCIRYPSHNNVNCSPHNPEEQCSDSGRGASDDDMKVLNINGSLASSSRALTSAYGIYTTDNTTTKTFWKDNLMSIIPRERPNNEEEGRIFDRMTPNTQAVRIPMTTFQSSYNLETMNRRSNLRSDSYDSLSNLPRQSNNIHSSNSACHKNGQLFSLSQEAETFNE